MLDSNLDCIGVLAWRRHHFVHNLTTQLSSIVYHLSYSVFNLLFMYFCDAGQHELSVLSVAEGESPDGDCLPLRTDQENGGTVRTAGEAAAPGTTVLLRNQFVVAATVHMVESWPYLMTCAFSALIQTLPKKGALCPPYPLQPFNGVMPL